MQFGTSVIVVILIFLLLQPTTLKRMEAVVCHLIRTLWLMRSARHHLDGRRWQYSEAVLLTLLTLEMYYHLQRHCFHLTAPTSQAFIAGFQFAWLMMTFIQGQHLMHTVNTLLLPICYLITLNYCSISYSCSTNYVSCTGYISSNIGLLWTEKTWQYTCSTFDIITLERHARFSNNFCIAVSRKKCFTHSWKIYPFHLDNILTLPCKSETITFHTYNALLVYDFLHQAWCEA